MKKAAMPSILVAVVFLALKVIAEAQQPTKIPRIGYLSVSSLSAMADRIEARLGYKLPVRDKNVFTSPEEDFDEYKDCDGCSNSTAVCWMCVSTAASGGSDLLGAFEKL